MQNSARHEQRNDVPKPWGTQGGDSSLSLLMRVWISGYGSQTSCSPVQTWISDTETPWPYQIAKASLEARRFPLRIKGLWVVFRPSLTLYVMLWGLSTLYTFPFKNLSRCIWAISPPLSILPQSNCARLMPQECVKRSLSCAFRRLRKPSRLSAGPS